MEQTARPKSEWLVSSREDLRIVPVDLELRVQIVKDAVANSRQDGKTTEQKIFSYREKPASHLFAGTLRCGSCMGKFGLVSGRRGGYLGCVNAHKQMLDSCGNRQMVQMSWVQWSLIEELQGQMENPFTWDHIAKRYNQVLMAKGGEIPDRLRIIEIQIHENERAISNYAKFISEGHWSETISQNLGTAEAKTKDLKIEREYLQTQVKDKVFITPSLLRQKTIQIQEILGSKTIEANRLLKHLFSEKITMTPQVLDKKKSYVASGTLNLFALQRFSLVANGGH